MRPCRAFSLQLSAHCPPQDLAQPALQLRARRDCTKLLGAGCGERGQTCGILFRLFHQAAEHAFVASLVREPRRARHIADAKTLPRCAARRGPARRDTADAAEQESGARLPQLPYLRGTLPIRKNSSLGRSDMALARRLDKPKNAVIAAMSQMSSSSKPWLRKAAWSSSLTD